MASTALDDCFFFDDLERGVITRALEIIRAANPSMADLLLQSLERLARLAGLVRDYPPIGRPFAPLQRTATGINALIDSLCRVPDYDFELHIPTKAVLGQSYLTAKINLFKAFRYAIDEASGPDDLRAQLSLEIGQSVFSKLAEELFISVVTDPNGLREVKVAASQFLMKIWDDRLLTEVDDFAPLLESAWHARSRVRPVLGTMLGTHEIYRLFQESRDERLLDYFGGDDVLPEEISAFEEFMFGLSFEEIEKLRRHLADTHLAAISFTDAAVVLGIQEGPWNVDQNEPQAIYTSYKRRRVNATYRDLTGANGPKKTAEEYVMIALLRRGFEG